jgi:hypothetical protein
MSPEILLEDESLASPRTYTKVKNTWSTLTWTADTERGVEIIRKFLLNIAKDLGLLMYPRHSPPESY